MLKDTIYSIPLSDAFEDRSSCPFCRLFHKNELKMVEYCLGPAMMSPDFRERTNKNGFCSKHFNDLYAKGNHLSFSLVCSTHMDELISAIDKLPGSSAKKGYNVLKDINALHDSCVICDELDSLMNRYVSVFFHLYKKEVDFKKKFMNTEGFCLSHFITLYKSALSFLNNPCLNDFLFELSEKQKKYMSSLKDDIDFFCKKHDYRYKDTPWDGKQNSPKKMLNFLSDYFDYAKNSGSDNFPA